MVNTTSKYPPEVKAAAIEEYLLNAGKSVAKIAREMDIPAQTMRDWIKGYDPSQAVDYAGPTAESLEDLIYDTIVHTLHAIKARAIVTADPAWIERQEGSVLAQLDAAQWDRLIRVVSAFRPRDRPELPDGQR